MRAHSPRLSAVSMLIVLGCGVLSMLAATYVAVGSPSPGSSVVSVPDDGMAPVLRSGDRVVVDSGTPIGVGSVVVIDDPTGERPVVVKRVVAVEGQTVGIYGDELFVDERPESVLSRASRLTRAGIVKLPTTVPKGSVWVLGDNREVSTDSRFYGPVPVGSIRGVVSFVCWPPAHVDVVGASY